MNKFRIRLFDKILSELIMIKTVRPSEFNKTYQTYKGRINHIQYIPKGGARFVFEIRKIIIEGRE